MNKQKLVDLLKNPSTIDAKHLEEVEEMVKENPYFQSAYALIAVGKKKTKAAGAGKDLVRAAIYATNRAFLKSYIENASGGEQATSPTDAVVEPEKPIKKEEPKETPKPESSEKESKPKYTERFVEDKSKKEVKEEAPTKAEKPKAEKTETTVPKKTETVEPKKAETAEPKKAETTDTQERKPIDVDIDNLLGLLKSEYKQLETNIQSFDKAEKDLTAAEIKEDAEKSKPRATRAKATTSTTKKTTAKKTTTRTTKAKTTTAASKTASKAKAPTAKKTTASTRAKKPSTTTAKKTSTSSTKPKSTPRAKSTSTKSGTSSKKDDSSSDGDSSKKKEQKKLIDNFIKTDPKITRKKPTEKGSDDLEDLSKKNQVLTDDMVTENLATIMIKQGRFEKAIEIYNKLIWKFPHKQAYFAGRIKELKEQ